MLKVRAALDKLTLAKDGVDGKSVYVYGEGWNFGEVANDALFVQARQGNLGGTGIGTFSDRLRDGVRGGARSTRTRGSRASAPAPRATRTATRSTAHPPTARSASPTTPIWSSSDWPRTCGVHVPLRRPGPSSG